jgi:hypothetical protein
MRYEAITLVFAMGIGSVLMAVRDESAQQTASAVLPPGFSLVASAPEVAGRKDFEQKK